MKPKGMQVRYRVNGSDWSQWTWLEEYLSWTYSKPTIETMRFEFRWEEIPIITPTFTTDQ